MNSAETTGQGRQLGSLEGLRLRRESLAVAGNTEFGLVHTEVGPRIAVLAPRVPELLQGFEGEVRSHRGSTLLVGPTSSRNAKALRARLPWMRPRTVGTGTSVGFGDRLGLATPGHVRALRSVGREIAPVFAQQSIREMVRTGRGPQEVLDDATWGAFAEGWHEGFGADADHLKTPEDTDACLAAGYTMFTFDPGEHVDDAAESAEESALREAFERLPWEHLEDRPADLEHRYLNRRFEYEEHLVAFDERTLHEAAVKYGRAVAHVAEMYHHLKGSAAEEFEVEVSVDETASPTTHVQHVYLATEMQRLGVEWVSLAPRYVGTFEKGVDYIGDVEEFEADFAVHAAIARGLGPYKLSLHSGSDKFSIYPAAVRQTRGTVHLKTAGTSYLEGLRVVASLDPGLFREIYTFCRERYEKDRASYHVSAETTRAPAPHEVDEAGMPEVVDQFDAREILHVTFGSVLRPEDDDGRRRLDRLLALLKEHPGRHTEGLERHFLRHLEHFGSERRA